jgi:hypothetical protein
MTRNTITESEKKRILEMHRSLMKEQTDGEVENLHGTEKDPAYVTFVQVAEKCLKVRKDQVFPSKDKKRYFVEKLSEKGNKIRFYSDMNVYKADGTRLTKFYCPQVAGAGQLTGGQQAGGQQAGGQPGAEPALSQSQKSALDYIAKQGFVRMKPEPDNFKVQNKEFIKLDLNNPEGEVESGYSNVFTDLVVSEFKGKFPKGLFVYKKTGKEAPAASSQKIEITRENCRKAVFELHDYMKNRQSTLMTPEQRRTNVQTVRRCMDNRNKLGALNFEYNRKLKDLQDNNEI